MRIGIRNNCYFKCIRIEIGDGQADAIEADAAVWNDEGSPGFRKIEPEVPAAFHIADGFTDQGGICMALHQVPVQQGGQGNGSLQVDDLSGYQLIESGLGLRFLDDVHRMDSILDADHRQAYPIVADTLIDVEFIRHRGSNRYGPGAAIFCDGNYIAGTLYNA